jgi:ankyrin repeat protein
LIFLSLFPFTVHAGSSRSKDNQWPLDQTAKQEPRQGEVEAFVESIERGDVASVNRALAAGMSPNLKDGGGRPALLLAIRTGRVEVVKSLLEQGADVSAEYKSWTALGLAAQNGHLKMVNLLLKKGAQVNGEGDCHHTALIMAAEGAMLKSEHDFLWQRIPLPANGDQGEDYDDLGDVRNSGGDHVEIARTLINKGADVNVKSDCETGDWTATALVTASLSGNVELVELLLTHGADPNAKTAATPLTLLTTDNEMMREIEIDESDSPAEKRYKQAFNEWSESLRPRRDRIVEMLVRAGAK